MKLTIAARAPVVLVIGAAFALAWTLARLGDQPIVYDSLQYIGQARLLTAQTLGGWELRTYGYPAFLVPWAVLAGPNNEAFRTPVLLIQVTLHLAASWLFARRVALALGTCSDERLAGGEGCGIGVSGVGLGPLTFVLVALNPFLLIATGALLSESLSVSLLAAGTAVLLPVPKSSPSTVLRDGVLGLMILALAAEVRPANAIVLAVGALLWTARWCYETRPSLGTFGGGLALVGILAILPLIPQMFINWRPACPLTAVPTSGRPPGQQRIRTIVGRSGVILDMIGMVRRFTRQASGCSPAATGE